MPNIRLRRDTAANWTAADPVLLLGEAGLETDTLKWKVGDGVTVWSGLSYFNVSGGGGGNLTISRQAGDFAAANGNLYVVDASGATRTGTLPGSPAANDRIGFYFEAGSGSNTVNIARNGNLIAGQAFDDTLFVAEDATGVTRGDYKEYQYDATATNWIPISDNISAHRAAMRLNTAQLIPNNTPTSVTWNSTDFDIGGIADLAGDRFLIRRTGQYQISFSVGFFQAIDASEFLILYIDIGGVRYMQDLQYGVFANSGSAGRMSHVFEATQGDAIEFYIFHNEGASINTSTTFQQQPYASIQEIRL